jgi:hypothetical protein
VASGRPSSRSSTRLQRFSCLTPLRHEHSHSKIVKTAETVPTGSNRAILRTPDHVLYIMGLCDFALRSASLGIGPLADLCHDPRCQTEIDDMFSERLRSNQSYVLLFGGQFVGWSVVDNKNARVAGGVG